MSHLYTVMIHLIYHKVRLSTYIDLSGFDQDFLTYLSQKSALRRNVMAIVRMGIVWLVLSMFSCVVDVHATLRENVYLGLGCGAVFDEFDFEAKNVNTGFAIHKKARQTSCLGTVFFGYGYTNDDCFYLGGEIGTNFPRRISTLHRKDVALTDFTFTNVVAVQDYLTVDVLPGYRISDECLIYARIGGSYGNVGLKLEANELAGAAEYNFHQDRYGLRAGLGINYAYSELVGFGIDYYYTGYQKIKTFIGQYATDQNQRPQTHYVGLSLILSFPCNGW